MTVSYSHAMQLHAMQLLHTLRFIAARDPDCAVDESPALEALERCALETARESKTIAPLDPSSSSTFSIEALGLVAFIISE